MRTNVFLLLKERVNNAIENIRRKRASFEDGPINWSNLQCSDVSIINDASGARFRITVEEASPDATKFKEYLADRIRQELLVEVEVRTEW